MPNITVSEADPIRIYVEGNPEPLLEVRPGGLEGGLRIIAYKADFENPRNFQGGAVGSPNLDISAGGDGSSPDQPRGVVVINRDNGRGMDIGRGRPARGAAMQMRAYANGARDVVLFRVPVRFAKGAWHWNGERWVKYT